MHDRTKHTQISASVKRKVWERDHGYCIYCGSPDAAPEAHFIPRSHGGLGIEENVLTLCRRCHYLFDETSERGYMKEYFRWYLKENYPGWNEEKLIYRKE